MLSMLDINRELPELYFSTSNRNAGKTTFFVRHFVNQFLKNKKKTVYLFRYSYELNGDCAGKVFGGVGDLFFKDYIFTQKKTESGKLVDFYIQDKEKKEPADLIGYAVSISDATNIKKFSHKIKADFIFFDEFQPEFNTYLSDEMNKFKSIHQSLARGEGKQVKYLPVIFASNTVTLLNPYFTELGISARLNKNVKFLRGVGWVLEQNLNESAAAANAESAFNRAFAAGGSGEYSAYANSGEYLNDSDFNIVKSIDETPEPLFSIYERKAFFVFENCKKLDKLRVRKARGPAKQVFKRLPREEGSFSLLPFEQKLIIKSLFENDKIIYDSLESKDLIFKLLSY